MTFPQRLRTLAGRASRYRGMLVVVLWQAPVGPAVTPQGSLTFVFGSGADELASLNCDGSVEQAREAPYRLVGLEADRDLVENIRVEAVAGFMQSDLTQYNGGFGGLLVRADWRYVGLGLGGVIQPHGGEHEEAASMTLPSIYVRAGPGAATHLRGDVAPPTAIGRQQIARLGMGINAIDRHRPSIFLGVVVVGLDEGAAGVGLDLGIPLGDNVAVSFRGHFAAGHRYDVSGFTLGARYVFW